MMLTPRILVVEDETIEAMDLAAMLRRLGYEVVGSVGTRLGAIAAARSMKPDLILMDIRLGEPMDGVDAVMTIRQEHSSPIVFLIAPSGLEALERSGAAYLVKPISQLELHRAVEAALQTVLQDARAMPELRKPAPGPESPGKALSQLAGEVAHDLNNKLMVIFARCDLLLRTVESEKQRQFVDDIRAAARKSQALTQQLLDAARESDPNRQSPPPHHGGEKGTQSDG